ncbi:MAG: HDIG domain-containing protein [Bacteroidales bacterium]|nr:HDIG domain-containing protein [Bacteroidales bacterium]
MKRELYIQIKKFLREVIRGTEFEGHVMTVGGCVRDELMGLEIKDIDMCVSLPGGGIRFAEWLKEKGLTTKGVTVYPNYGTAMLHLTAFPDVELEFVQTRKERYIDHSCRNPETAFGTIEDDCMRRDLTINALYCNVSTDEIIDITGNGVNDIRDHIIRTPADPDLTYDDDPLRILRCIRFASRYGWDVEAETMAGMKRNAFRLEIITKERIHDEFCKMATCQYPVMAMELLRETGSMHFVIPELEETYSMMQNEYHFGTVWEHTLAVLGSEKLAFGNGQNAVKSEEFLVLWLAALLHDIGKIRCREVTEDGKVHFLKHEQMSAEMIDELLRPLKFSNEIIKEVAFLVRNHMICKTWGYECEHMKDKKLRRLHYECKTEEHFRLLMTLIHADNMAHAEGRCMPRQVELILRRTEQMKAEGSAMFGYKLPLTGKEVMDMKGFTPGPAVKECLEYLMKVAFANPLREREEFVKHLLGYRLQR